MKDNDYYKANESEKVDRMLQLLEWSYDKAMEGLPKMGTAVDLAKDYINEKETKEESDDSLTRRVNSLIRWQISKTATSGFLAGLGGIALMPLTVPVNIASVIYVQMRMVTAIAHLGDFDVTNPKVKSFIFASLAGKAASDILKNVGVNVGRQFTIQIIKNIGNEVLRSINRAVGFRLVTKFGASGLIVLGKAIPLVGGIIGGSFDGITTNVIGNAAKKIFIEEGEAGEKVLVEKEGLENEDFMKSELQRFYCYLNVIKIDGEIRPEEKDLLLTYIQESDLTDDLIAEIISKIKGLKQIDINYSLVKQNLQDPITFIEKLIRLAAIDFEIHDTEKKLIERIAKELDVPQDDFMYMFINENFTYSINKNTKINIYASKLLSYKNAGFSMYFDEETGSKIPMIDLLKETSEIERKRKEKRSENYKEEVSVKKEWEGTDYITNIRIKDFKLLKDIVINLSKNINIILGNNGLGKTSILQAITLGKLPIKRVNGNARKFRNLISFGQNKSEIITSWGENETRKLYIFQKERPDEEKMVKPSQPLLFAYGVNLNTNDDKEHNTIVRDLIDGAGDFYFTESIFEESYDKMHDPLIILEYLDREIKTAYDTEIIRKHILENIEVSDEIKKVITNEIKEIVLINHLILTTINDFLSLLKETEQIQLFCDNENGHVYRFKDFNGNTLKTHNLSEGYKDHILLITDIITKIIASRKIIFEKEYLENTEVEISTDLLTNAKGLILIDEFDRHLHPIWQRKLLFQLRKTFANIQFVLTTHNVFSVQSAVGATAHKLLLKENKIQIESHKVEAQNILSVIDEYYTKDFFDYETQKKINIFSDYLEKINNGDIELVYSAEFKNLVQEIYNLGDEMQDSIASQLLQLNSSLKRISRKEFRL